MRTPLIALAAAAVTGASALMVAPSPALAVDEVDTRALRQAVTVNGILAHERVLQRIANENGGTRASGTPGYTASANYVKQRLKAAGYDVKDQYFSFPFFRELGDAELEQVSPGSVDYAPSTLQYSGSGTVTGTLVPTRTIQIPPPATPGTSTSGCAAGDFVPASATEQQVALVQRGTCDFAVKAANAAAAGYDAVLIFNEGQPGRTVTLEGTLGGPVSIPVLGLSFEEGSALYTATQAGPVVVRASTSTESKIGTTRNVLATTRGGNADKVVVVGAHLDSVVEGAGINDNGSGTSAILEIAEQMSELGIQPEQKVRFAFWGAEESGLLGSEHYVASLSDANLSKIYANLNFDMVGSPNYARFVYDGDGSDTPVAGPAGSGQIESIFTNYFSSQGLASDPTEFSGRSDYGPFIAVGIPAGGLFTGAEGVKTPEQAARYGGTAGVAYDPCYHQACDDIRNVNTKALNEMGDAAAHATATLALTKTGFFEDGSRAAARTNRVAPSTFDYDGSHLVR